MVRSLFLSLVFIFSAMSVSHAQLPLESQTTIEKYSLLLANLDGSDIQVIRTSNFQEMTHPRVSADKDWVAYTAYTKRDAQGCASITRGYINTEIRAVRMDGSMDKAVIPFKSGQFTSNSYWFGGQGEFIYLSGPPSKIRFYRATVDTNMTLTSGPTKISVPPTILPMDPHADPKTNKIVFPGLYHNPTLKAFTKSLFLMDLAKPGDIAGLTTVRDNDGKFLTCKNLTCTNIMENDPKISPNGDKVVFMRQVPDIGEKGHGWNIFVISVKKPFSETNISKSAIGTSVLMNDVLPEWIDNDTLLFSTIEIGKNNSVTKDVYTMKSDGTQRKKIPLPQSFRYSDVFPFVDDQGKTKIVIAAEKDGIKCVK